MTDYYSFNISREEAKNRELRSEPIYSEAGFDKKLFNFKRSWKGIKKKATKYTFHQIMEEKTLEDNDKLIYFLTDDNETNFGMYFAAAYENFISWQNDFLKYIIENAGNKSNLKIYVEYMKKEIPIYEANTNQILLINNCFYNSIFTSFDDLINVFSKRDIFNKDGKINYLNYNNFEYDISSIEEELAKLLLTGKCLFEKDNLKFVIYLGEAFNRGKSNILEKFYNKYKQTDLNEKEKELILRFMRRRENMDKNQFFASLQLLIFYLGNNNLDEKDTINKIIEEAPNYLRIEEICKDFFRENGKELKSDKIMSIFFFFEHLCFKELSQNILDDYKKEINEEILEKITNKLNNNEINEKISIKELGAAVRRFISRYLVGKKQNIDIKDDIPLLPLLKKPELWEEKIAKLSNLNELITHLLEEFGLTVKQAFKLYELIKEEDEKEIEFKEEDENNNNNNNDSDNENEENLNKPLPKKKKKLGV